MREAPSAHHAQDRLFGQAAVRPDRLPGLAAIIDAFADALAKEAEKLLRAPFSCLVEGIDPVDLRETLAASRGLATAVLFSQEINAQAFLIFDGKFGWMMIDACFLGASVNAAAEGERQSPARATSVGARFVTEVARIAATALATAFSKITAASFTLRRMEAADDAPLAERHDAPMLAVRIAVKSASGESRLVLLLPQSAIGRLRQGLSEAPPEEAPDDPAWTRELVGALSTATVRVAAVMEDLQLTLEEVSNLKVGKVLGLHGAGAGRVRLTCNGRDLFWCQLTQNDERYELEVE